MKVKCPTCAKEVVWSKEEAHRPFCSERCQMIDLGAWADGSNAIPGKTVEEEMFSEQWDVARQTNELIH